MGSIGATETTHHLYPPFPSDIKTAPLVSISLNKLENGDAAESKAFYEASKSLGFFYMNLEGSALGDRIIAGAEALHQVQQEFFQRPNEEKEEFAREKIDAFFGYRRTVLEEKDEQGNFKRNETYNMRKDDFLGLVEPLPCHPLALANWTTLKSYAQNCRQAIDLLISHLETHLELPPGTLSSLHRLHARSGDHVRFNSAPPQPYSPARAQQAEHTDFGSLTLLMNWLGGLQIRHPQTHEWVYVRPLPGSAVVNLGDALVKFTAGVLRSNVHRVVPAPPPQDRLVRDSLVYFSRPEDSVVLKRLRGGVIDAQPRDEKVEAEPELTAQEWTWRRSVGDLKGVYTHRGGLEARENMMVSGTA